MGIVFRKKYVLGIRTEKLTSGGNSKLVLFGGGFFLLADFGNGLISRLVLSHLRGIRTVTTTQMPPSPSVAVCSVTFCTFWV